MARRLFRILVGLACVVGSTPFLVSPVHASSQDLYISISGSNTTTGSNPSNCTNEATPCKSLSYALTQASSGATIVIEGFAYLRMTATTTPVFIPSTLSPLTIVGANGSQGFLEPTGSEVDTVNAAGLYVSSGVTLTIKNVTFDGFETQYYPTRGGGALFIDSGATVTIQNCLFEFNEAMEANQYPGSYADGGAILNQGSLTVSGTVFKENGAVAPTQNNMQGTLQGGAIYNGGSLTMSSSIVYDNTLLGGAQEQYFFYGAGIANAGSMSLVNATVTQNSIEYGPSSVVAPLLAEGGGIFNTGVISMIANSTIADNYLSLPQTPATYGGGIFNNNAIDEISMSTIYGNFTSDTNTATNPASTLGAGIDASIGFSSSAPIYLAGDVIAGNKVYINLPGSSLTSQPVNCSVTGTGASITSLGYNVSDTSDCNLTQSTDNASTSVAVNYSIGVPSILFCVGATAPFSLNTVPDTVSEPWLRIAPPSA